MLYVQYKEWVLSVKLVMARKLTDAHSGRLKQTISLPKDKYAASELVLQYILA